MPLAVLLIPLAASLAPVGFWRCCRCPAAGGAADISFIPAIWPDLRCLGAVYRQVLLRGSAGLPAVCAMYRAEEAGAPVAASEAAF